MKAKLLTRGGAKRGFFVLALWAVTLLLTAGCASSSGGTAAFRRSFSTSVGELGLTAHAVARSIGRAPSLTGGGIESRFQRLATRWRSSVSRLQSLSPPAAVAGEFHKLVGSATRVERDLNAVVAAADAQNTTAARHAAIRLVIDILTAKSTSITIRHQLR